MPPGKITTYQSWAAELRKKKEEEEALGRLEREEVRQAANTWRAPQPQPTTQTKTYLPIVSAPQPAPQRGYDPRFDDPEYGLDPKDRRQAGLRQAQPAGLRQAQPPAIEPAVRSDTLASLQAWRPRVDTGPAAFTAQQVQSPTVASAIRPLGAVQGAATEEEKRAQRWSQPTWKAPAATSTALLTASRIAPVVAEAGVRGVQSAWNAWNEPEEEETQSTLRTPALRARVDAVRRTPLTPSQMETTRMMQNPLVETGLAANQAAQERDSAAHQNYMRNGLEGQPEITRRETWLDRQPAFQQYQQRARENRERVKTGEISSMAALLRGLGNWIFVAPTEVIAGLKIPITAESARLHNLTAGKEVLDPNVANTLTIGQISSAIGGTLNKFNPFVPLLRQDPNALTVYDAGFWKTPPTVFGYNLLGDPRVYDQNYQETGQLTQGKYSSPLQYLTEQVAGAVKVEEYINSLPPEQQEMARQTVILGSSGYERQLAAIKDLQKKFDAPNQMARADQVARIAEMRYQMDVARAQASGLQQPRLMEEAERRRMAALTMAGGLYSDARHWQSLGTSEIIDNRANVWSEMAEGILFDPINLLDPFTDILVNGVLRGARYAIGKPLSAAKELIAPTKSAVELLDAALPAARRIGQQVVEGAAPKLPGYNWIDRAAVIGKTADAKAHLDRDVVWSFFARTLTNAQNAQDAQRLINTAIENPSQLVKGVKGLTGQQFQDISGFGGAVKFGGSSVANRELLDRLWLMQSASEELHALKSLRGDGYNMLEVMAEVDTILYRKAREAYGLKSLEAMPLNAVDYRQVAMADGRARLEWLNDKGRVLGSTVPMTARQANEYQKSLRAALKGAQQSPLLRAVRSLDQVQRAVMSDLWLNLRPGHWIRNAMAATATLMTDDLYSLRPVQGILDDLVRKGVPDARVMEAMATDVAFGAAGEGMGMDAGQHWSRKVWENNNAYAWANEQANRMWTGFTHVLGNVPFGEQAFYVRAFDRSFGRAFADLWKGVVTEEIGPRLQAAGLEAQTAQRVTDAIISAGVYGNKADIASRVRSLINGAYDPIDLRSLGVPDELVSAEGWKEIDGWIKYLHSQKQLAPDAISRAQRGVQRVFVRETERAAELLRQAPLQPGVYDRLSGDAALDGAALVDELTEAGVQGGMPRAQAQEQAVQFAKQHVEQSNQIQEELVGEIARVENPRAMTFAVDAWAKLHALRRQARAQVDELSQAAARYGGSKEARGALWAKKWEGTQRIYTEMIANMQEVVNDARLALAGGEEAAATFDWWIGIQRYLDYDDALIQEARQTSLFATTRDPELWETVVDANRAYVDQAWLPMFHAVRRFPTVDALDVVADVVNRVEMFGATTSSYLRPFRDLALAKQLPWDEYWPIRNGAWRHWADMSRTYIEDAQRRITLLGLADSTETKLKWNDPFAGGDFLLAGPGKEGTWFAYRMDDWSVHRFSEAGGESALPEVPAKIIDDWERVIGTDDAQLDAAVEEIRQAAARTEPPTPVTPKVEPTESARTGAAQAPGAIEPDAVLSPSVDAPVSLESNIDDVWQEIKRLTAEKRAIADELAQVQAGEAGDLGGLTEGVRPLEPLPDAPLADEINFNKLPYETPTVRPIERPATGFEDIPPRAAQVDESIPSETIPIREEPPTTIPSGGEAVQRLNNRLAEIDAERARLLDLYSRLRYMQRNGETRLIRGAVDPDAPHAAMPDLPEPPGVEPLMPPDVPPAAIDPNARLTKPTNWQSTQRTSGVEVGDQVQTVRSVYGFEREGTVSRVRGTMVEVELYNHIRKRVETKRFKLENVKRIERAPTPNELEEGRRIAEAAGMAQPARTRAPYETPTLRPVARPDDIAYAGYPKRAYEAPTMRPVARPDDIPATPYGPQQAPVLDRNGDLIKNGDVLRFVGNNNQPGDLRYTVVNAVPDADGNILIEFRGVKKKVSPRAYFHAAPGEGYATLDYGPALDDTVRTPLGEGTVTGVTRRNGQVKSVDVEIDGVQKTFSPENVTPIGGVQEAPSGAIMEGEGLADGVSIADAGRVDRADDRALAGVLPEDGANAGQAAARVSGGGGEADAGRVRQADRQRAASPGGVGDDAQRVVPDSSGGSPGAEGVLRGDGPGDGRDVSRAEPIAHVGRSQANSGRDYVITPADNLEDFGGSKARFRTNVDAIRLLKRIEGEGRLATAEEQAILARYSGMGDSQIAQGVFLRDKLPYYDPARKGWEEEYNELKKLLTDEEFAAASKSTPNAHYTSPTVVGAMWDGLRKLGFGKLNTLRVLEPSGGVGNFFGLMPNDLAARAMRTGVEIDQISGRIFRQLYQNANVYVTGFEKAPIPDNFYDLVISNFPFGRFAIFDPKYKAARFRYLTQSVHNYFFAKSLDKVRPGGMIAAITSSYTMNAGDKAIREYISNQADLVAAIRLPGTAFKRNAGTDVVTDILFLRKRLPGEAPSGDAWIDTVTKRLPDKHGELKPQRVNEYFEAHPENVLGRESSTGTMYAGGQYNVESGGDLAAQLAEAVRRLPDDLIQPGMVDEGAEAGALSASTVKRGSLRVENGKVRRSTDTGWEDVATNAQDVPRIEAMLAIRDAARETIDVMRRGGDDAALQAAQSKLNSTYDAFVGRYKQLNHASNRALLEGDADGYLLQGLEIDGRKADIFSRRVISGAPVVKWVESARDGLMAVLSERGRVDMDQIAKLYGKSTDEVVGELGDLVYKQPYGDWETADAYLSGNVRQKLKQAEDAAQVDAQFQRNVDALRKVLPEPLQPGQIYVRVGSQWIPPQVFNDWINEVTGYNRNWGLKYTQSGAAWSIENNLYVGKQSQYSTARADVMELIEDSLNQKLTRVMQADPTDPEGKRRIVDLAETKAAQKMQRKLQDHFADWIWRSKHGEKMAAKYNDEFNNMVQRSFDGSHLKLPGVSTNFYELRPNQRNGIWRMLQSGNTLLAHEVGAGKTFTMIGGAAEMKRIGLAKKPLFVVPKNKVGDFVKDWREMYPAARVLAPLKGEFDPATRPRFMSRVATGDWDAVVISQEQFKMLPVTDVTFNAYLEDEIRALDAVIEDMLTESNGKKTAAIKRLETKRNNYQVKLRRTNANVRRDDTILFEDLGVDALFVDEAHEYKNLDFATRLNINVSSSEQAMDMYMKVRWINKMNNGRNVVFATGTPVANSVAEAWTMMRYLMPDELSARGLDSFDAFAGTFGDYSTKWEYGPAGRQLKTRFNRFANVPELHGLMTQTMDVMRWSDMPWLKLPKMKGGKRTIVELPETEQHVALRKWLETRLDAIKKKHGPPQKGDDIVLSVYTDMRKAALDIRLINPSLPDLPDSKVNRAVANILETYQRTNDRLGAQLVFSDMGTPGGVGFNIYDDMKRKLIKGGIPESQIGYIHDATNDAKKMALFEAVNEGRVRVLIGSTEKMGQGINVQKRIAAIHQLDGKYRPADIIQREGRAIRDGNIFEEVDDVIYAQQPMDAFMWGLVEGKVKAINSLVSRKVAGRTLEELEMDETAQAMAAINAAASGDPLFQRLVELRQQLEDLTMERSAHTNRVSGLRREASHYEMQQSFLQNQRRSLNSAIYNTSSDNLLTINGTTYGSVDDEVTESFKQALESAPVGERTTVGEYRNWNLVVDRPFDEKKNRTALYVEYATSGQTQPLYRMEVGTTLNHYRALLRDAMGIVDTMPQELRRIDSSIEHATSKIAEFERAIGAWPGAEKMRKTEEAILKLEAEFDDARAGATEAVDEVPQGAAAGQGDADFYWAFEDGAFVKKPDATKVEIEGLDGEFFVHVKNGEWAVSEARTGLRVSDGRTQTDAIDDAQAKMGSIGQDKFDQLVKKRVNEKGLSPRFLKAAPDVAEAGSSLGIVAPGTEQAQKVLDFFGTGAEKLWDVTKRNLHKGRHPTVSDVAAHQVRTMADAERKVLEYVGNINKAAPNKLTAQQRLAVMDAVDAALPRFDDAVYASTQVAKKASDGAMLNFKDRRHFDSALSMLFPFHFFWTRSAKNWAKRVAKHPGVLNAYYEVERAIENENNQAGVPSRLRGTIPLWRRADGSQIRIGNPLHYALPFGMYFPQSQYFSEPDENQTEFDRWVAMVRQYTPGLLPGLQMAGDALMDQISPLADGKRTDKYYVGSFIPQYAMANSAYKAATGKELPGARDPYDPYRAARAAAELGTSTGSVGGTSTGSVGGTSTGSVGGAPLTAEMASYAQQIAANVQRGNPRYTNIPLDKQQAAEQAFIQSQQRAGMQRGLTQATGYVTGVPAYQWPAQEQAGRQMMDQYRQAGYSAESNPYGSKAAQTQVREGNPALSLWWQKGSAAPGAEGEPGVSAQLDPLYDRRNELYDQRQQQSQAAVDRAIGADPNIGGAAMSDARSAVYDQYGQKIDPLTQQIDSLRSQLPADADPQSGYNPSELQERHANQVMAAAAQLPGRPDEANKPLPPGDGATDAQWAAYKRAIAGYSTSWDSYRARQRQYVIDNLAAKEMGMPQYGQPYAGALTPEQAVQAWEQYQTRNQSPLEQARRGEIEQQQPLWDDYYRLMDVKNYNGARQLLDANPWMKDKLRRDAKERAAGGQQAVGSEQLAVNSGGGGQTVGGGDGVPWFDQVNMGAVRRQQISALYGDEGVGMYDAYIALPKASAERAAYRAANPEIKLVLLAGFNPNEYGQMVEMFGADALVAWANVPAYAETEEAKNARSEYFKANPQAWLVQSWLRGRPTPITENGEVDEVQNNFGADWKQAEAQFGAEIWQLAAAYRAADAETRKQMRAVTPISAFYDWWYANLPDNFSSGAPRATYISNDGLVTYDQYGRRLDSLGNVARSGYNGSRRKAYPPRWNTPEIYPRYMDRNNQVNIEDLRQWRPVNRANWWSVATDLKPDTPRPQRTSFK